MNCWSPLVLGNEPDNELLDDADSTEAARDEWADRLTTTLDSIESQGDFSYADVSKESPSPGLRVDGQPIPLPLLPRDAEVIKSKCHQAAFGRKDETVVDDSVRKTWELCSSQFGCANQAWQGFVHSRLASMAKTLGMSGDLRCEPFKLLLYESGSFFKRHKDSEKAPGMVATLVICLPSMHEGGEVHLSHAGKNLVSATGPSSEFDVTSLGWYSDVTHEIKEVTSGYRLVLTYNIIQTSGVPTSASFFDEQNARLELLLQEWKTNYSETTRMLYFLEHKYSPTSLSRRFLKGRDKTVFEALSTACSISGFYALLTNITKTTHEKGYGMDDDSLTLSSITSPDGSELCSHYSVDISDILGGDPYKDRAPDSEDEAEFTGNASQPAEYRYHDSAIFLIPKSRIHTLVSTKSWYSFSSTGQNRLLRLVMGDMESHPDDPEARAASRRIMEKILKQETSDDGYYQMRSHMTNTEKYKQYLMYANRIDDASMSCHRQILRILSETYQFQMVAPTISTIAELKFSKSPDAADWDQFLGETVTRLASMMDVSEVLSHIAAGLTSPDLVQSFAKWNSGVEEMRWNNIASIGEKDLEYIMPTVYMSLKKGDGWVARIVLPKLKVSSGPTKPYLFSEHLQNWAQGYPDRVSLVRPVLEYIVDSFPPLQVDWPSFRPARSTPSTAPSMLLDLVQIHLTLDLKETATKLIQSNCHSLVSHLSGLEHSGVPRFLISASGMMQSIVRNQEADAYELWFQDLLQPLMTTLQRHNHPPPPAMARLFEIIARRTLIGQPPQFPTPPPGEGWAHKPRTCGNSRCQDCPTMRSFLVDPHISEARFSKNLQYRQHLESQLPREFYLCHTEYPKGKAQVLYVRKRAPGSEYSAELASFWNKVAEIERKVAPFRNEDIHRLLGDDLFRELVLLEKIKPAGGSGPAAPPPQGTAGFPATGPDGDTAFNASKRPAPSEQEYPAAKKMKVEDIIDLT